MTMPPNEAFNTTASAAFDADLVDLETAQPEDFAPRTNGHIDHLAAILTGDPEGGLEWILSGDPEQWYAAHALAILAHFRPDAIQWGRIEERCTALRGSAYNLRKAVDQWVTTHPPVPPPSTDPPGETPPLTPEAQLQQVYASRDPEVWHAHLALLATIRQQPSAWFLARSKAKQNGINDYRLEAAVDDVLASQRQKERTETPGAASQTAQKESREEALALLAQEWEIPITGCVRHGKEGSTWHLVLEDGREVHLGNSAKAIKEDMVRAAIFDSTGRYIKHYGKKGQERWRELMQLLAELAVMVDTPEMTPQGKVEELLRGYLMQEHLTLEQDTPEWEDLARATRPFVHHGHLYLHARHLVSSYAHHMMPEIDHAQIMELLRGLGAVQDKVTINKHKTSRSFWHVALNKLPAHPEGSTQPSAEAEPLPPEEGTLTSETVAMEMDF